MFLKSTGVKMILSEGKSAHSRMSEAQLREDLGKTMQKLCAYQKMFSEKNFSDPLFFHRTLRNIG